MTISIKFNNGDPAILYEGYGLVTLKFLGLRFDTELAALRAGRDEALALASRLQATLGAVSSRLTPLLKENIAECPCAESTYCPHCRDDRSALAVIAAGVAP